jgi:hypothetical protein
MEESTMEPKYDQGKRSFTSFDNKHPKAFLTDLPNAFEFTLVELKRLEERREHMLASGSP